MKFDELLHQIAENPNQSIYFSSTDSDEETTFHKFYLDIKALHSELEALNLPPRSRVGLLGDNSYAWLVWSIALVTANHVPVHLSEEHFGLHGNKLVIEYSLSFLVSDRHSNSSEFGMVNIKSFKKLGSVKLNRYSLQETDTDVLCLVFSSGTTGHMKGLVISKVGTEAIISQFVSAFEVSSSDHYFSFLPFSYFQQAALNYCALFHGVKISVTSPERVTAELTRRNPTYIIAPPVFHQTIYKAGRLMEKAVGRNVVNEILGSKIRFMITAMAPIPSTIIDYFWEANVALYETYAVTETGMATWNTPSAYKIGTVGKEAEPGTLKIAADGELLIKRKKPVSLGYFNTSELITLDTFLPDGHVATGDIVAKDEDGFYRIVGRKKHAIITREGKKFHPEELEALLLKEFPQSIPVVFYDNTVENLGALICTANARHESVEHIKYSIKNINRELPTHKRILTAFLTDHALSYSNGFMTRNLKLNRKKIEEAINSRELSNLQQLI